MRRSHHTTAFEPQKHIPKGVEGGSKSIWLCIMLSLDSAYPLALAVALPVLCGEVWEEPQCSVAVSECDRVEETAPIILYIYSLSWRPRLIARLGFEYIITCMLMNSHDMC